MVHAKDPAVSNFRYEDLGYAYKTLCNCRAQAKETPKIGGILALQVLVFGSRALAPHDQLRHSTHSANQLPRAGHGGFQFKVFPGSCFAMRSCLSE